MLSSMEKMVELAQSFVTVEEQHYRQRLAATATLLAKEAKTFADCFYNIESQ